MAATAHEINRPVHLARRDVYFERAVDLLRQPLDGAPTDSGLEHLERIIRLLRTALLHADRAARSARAIGEEHDCQHFLRLVLENVLSARALLRNQSHVESEEGGFLARFLGDGAGDQAFSAVTYRRRAEDVLLGLWQILRLSHAPYRTLQASNLEALTPGEKERYHLAFESFRGEVVRRFPPLGDRGTAPAPSA